MDHFGRRRDSRTKQFQNRLYRKKKEIIASIRKRKVARRREGSSSEAHSGKKETLLTPKGKRVPSLRGKGEERMKGENL